jgi:microcystin degradation protein MlrC
MSRRILSAEINHETNTFSILPTTLPSYKSRRYYQGDEIKKAMAGTHSEMGAHIDAAKRYGWNLVQPISAHATPAGKTTAEAWAVLSNAVIEACGQGPFDGLLLALHGAMVTEDQDDAEGDLLRRLRARIGPEVPIAMTLDLHGNVTDTMARLANIIIAYRTYPHVDIYERAMEAADLLQRTMNGEIHPYSLMRRGPLLEGCDYGRTTPGGPMSRLIQKADQMKETDRRVLAISLCAGFPWADIPEVGPSVTVTGDGQYPEFQAIAEELMKEVWKTRREKTVKEVSLEEAMAEARNGGAGEGKPLLLADYSDNPGSGGYGDGITLLRAMIEAKLSNAVFACVADPEAVQGCIAAGTGREVTVALGAKIDPQTYGPSLVIRGVVEKVSDGVFTCQGPMTKGVQFSLGTTAVLRSGGVRVLVTASNMQVYDLQVFLTQGIDPRTCTVVAVKSWHHFRASFEPLSRKVMLVDSGGLASMDLKRFTFRKVRRPIWPLDDEGCEYGKV